MDQIRIKRLEIFANHGVLEEENRLGQKFLISVSMNVDAKIPGKSDELEDSVNYAAVSEMICRESQEHTFHLIESLAEYLAREILLQFPLVQSLELEVEKPWAPVKLPLETVSVRVKRGWHRVYLGLGSNLGDKEQNLRQAIEFLKADPENQVKRVSSLIETEPVGEVEQDDFLNGAVEILTLKTPEELLDQIGSIETELKRVRVVHWGPRTIDLDILLYDDQIIQTERLTIPHREMAGRQFVLEPMNEIAPYAVHPVEKMTIQKLFQRLCNCK